MHSDSFEHSCNISHNLIVPEPQHRETLRIEPVGSFCVLFLFLCMLTTVCFDNDALFITDKIGNEAANLFLSPKFQAVELLCFQVAP